MDNIVQKRVEQLKKKLAEANICCTREKDINYGHQMHCVRGSEELMVNIYHGKKGISIVIQGKDSPLKCLVETLANGGSSADEKTMSDMPMDGLHPAGIPCWMGCDESGKGDVFGPLVGAACLITKEEEIKLRRLGVCDSKMLTDANIAVLAAQIQHMLGERCITTVLMPREYNEQYNNLKRIHKNLNHLLGSLHGENICRLLSKHECPCIIVDKFGKEEYVLQAVGSMAASHQIIQVTKGERDIAVAAASILARNGFVDAIKTLSARYEMTFPKGAYLGIAQTIQSFCKAYGNHALAEVGKLNFKNFDFLR